MIECIVGTYVIVLVFGPNRSDVNIIENVKEGIGFVLLFILTSGYFATTAWVGVITHRVGVLNQMWANMLLFCAHAGGFLIITGAQIERTAGVLVLGVGVVAVASLVGGSLRALFPSNSKGVGQQV